jgi:hypothetical protein
MAVGRQSVGEAVAMQQPIPTPAPTPARILGYDPDTGLAITGYDPNTGKMIFQGQSSAPPPTPPSVGRQLLDSTGRMMLDTSDALSLPLRDPEGFVKQILSMPEQVFKAQGQQAQQAYEAVKRGDYLEAGGRGLASIVPILGPITADYFSTDQRGKEQIAGSMIGGMLMGKLPIPTELPLLPSFRTNTGTAAARAIDAARSEGVPVNAGVATGNRALTGMIQMAEKTTATGSGAVNRAVQATQSGLMDWADRLAADANPGGPKVSGAQAGEGVFEALKKTIKDEGATAERGYSVVEHAQQAGKLNGVPMQVVRRILQPIYDHLTQLNEATGGLDAATAPGQTKAYLDLIMKQNIAGSPVGEIPVIAAERVLGNLKEALRSQNNQYGATSAQLRTAIKTVQGQIDAAVKVDPDAFQALQDGRLATAKKYQAATTLDKLAGKDQMRSPITATNELLSDSGLTKLRRLAGQSPDQVQNLGRSFFEDAFKEARGRENGFKMDNAARDWRSMSDETKRILYKDAIAKDPAYLSRVDDFFTAANKIQENLNPSGTAAAALNAGKLVLAPLEAALGGHTGMLAAGATVAQDLGSNLFARAMNSPRVVSLMVDGLRLVAKNPAFYQTLDGARNLAAIRAIVMAGQQASPTPGVGPNTGAGAPSGGRGGGAGAYRGGS